MARNKYKRNKIVGYVSNDAFEEGFKYDTESEIELFPTSKDKLYTSDIQFITLRKADYDALIDEAARMIYLITCLKGHCEGCPYAPRGTYCKKHIKRHLRNITAKSKEIKK